MSQPEMDEVDIQFMQSLVPKDAMGLGFICGVLFLTSDGERGWRCYDTLDVTLTETLGLLSLMKMEVLGRCPDVLADLGFQAKL